MRIRDLPVYVLDVICVYTGKYPLEVFAFEGSRYEHDSATISLEKFHVCTIHREKASTIAKDVENPIYRNGFDFCNWDEVVYYRIDNEGNVGKKAFNPEQFYSWVNR